MSKFRPGFVNSQTFRLFTNNPRELFEYSMGNMFDKFYSNLLDTSIDGEFKAVCLSGVDGSNNSSLITDKYMNIIIRPLTDFGNMLPDPRNFNTPDEVNKAINLHYSAFLARSDYEFTDHTPIGFGQIVNCYYEKGSIKNSTFKGLRFREPDGMDIEQSFLKLADVEGVASGPKAFQPGANTPQLMGNIPSSEPQIDSASDIDVSNPLTHWNFPVNDPRPPDWDIVNFAPEDLQSKGNNMVVQNKQAIRALDKAASRATSWGHPPIRLTNQIDPSRNGAYRDPVLNKKSGGASRSRHLFGDGYDIYTKDHTAQQKINLLKNLYNVGFRGFGFGYNNFHADTSKKRSWKYGEYKKVPFSKFDDKSGPPVV